MAVYIRAVGGVPEGGQHAAWACHPLRSRGRMLAEEESPTRGMFQRAGVEVSPAGDLRYYNVMLMKEPYGSWPEQARAG